MKDKPKVVVVSRELAVLRTIADGIRIFAEVFETRNPNRVLQWVNDNPDMAVVIAEELLYCTEGQNLVETLREKYPATRRVVYTDYSNLQPIIAALHSGHINKLIAMPLDAPIVRLTLGPAGALAS